MMPFKDCNPNQRLGQGIFGSGWWDWEGGLRSGIVHDEKSGFPEQKRKEADRQVGGKNEGYYAA